MAKLIDFELLKLYDSLLKEKVDSDLKDYALPITTKYGAGLRVNGTEVQLKDAQGNNLGNVINT